jgi:hypothetical protein
MYTLERLDNMNEYQTYETAYKGNELFKTKKEEELEEKIKSELEVKLKKELEEKIKGELESKNKENLEKKENENLENYKPDSVVSSVINKFLERAKMGKEKYGTDLDRTDLSLYDWIIHAQDEHMDAILYLEKIKQLIVKK